MVCFRKVPDQGWESPVNKTRQREEPPLSPAGELGGVRRVTSELNSEGRGECVEPEIEGRCSRRARILREEQNQACNSYGRAVPKADGVWAALDHPHREGLLSLGRPVGRLPVHPVLCVHQKHCPPSPRTPGRGPETQLASHWPPLDVYFTDIPSYTLRVTTHNHPPHQGKPRRPTRK